MNFNKSRRVFLKKQRQRHRKMCILPPIWVQYPPIFPHIFLPSVTLVTAKKQHRCWKTCAYACARDCLLTLDTLYRKKHLFCNACLSLYVYCKEKSADFCDFFTLCPYFNAYMFRGWCVRKGAKRGRTEKGSSMRPIEYQVECLVFETSVWVMPPFRVSSSERKWRGRRASKDQRAHPKRRWGEQHPKA